jgi:stage II sporulation protein E
MLNKAASIPVVPGYRHLTRAKPIKKDQPRVAQWILACVIALPMARAVLPGYLTPFALSYFSAAYALLPAAAIPTALVLLISSFGVLSPLAVMMRAAGIVVYLFVDHLLPKERPWLNAGIAAILVRMPFLVFQGFIPFEIVSAGLETTLTCMLAFVLRRGLAVIVQGRGRALETDELMGVAVVLCGVLMGVTAVHFGSVSVATVLVLYTIMVLSETLGAGAGAAIGVLAGLMLNLEPPVTPFALVPAAIFAFSGLCAGLLAGWRKWAAGLGALVAYNLLSSLAYGPLDMNARLLESLLAGISFVVMQKRTRKYLLQHLGFRTLTAVDPMEVKWQKLASRKLVDMSEAFRKLANIFADAHKAPPIQREMEDLPKLIDKIIADVCTGCATYKVCWGKDFYHRYQSLFDCLTLTDLEGEISPDDLPGALQRQCGRARNLVDNINLQVRLYRLDHYWRDRMQESSALVAGQLNGVAELFGDLAHEVRLDPDFQPALEEQIRTELKRLEVPIQDVEVRQSANGRTSVQVTCAACQPGADLCHKAMIPTITACVGRQVSVHGRCPLLKGQKRCVLTFDTAQVLLVQTGIAQQARDGAGTCGDSVAVTELAGGKLALLLSDGMGNGEQASSESRAAVSVLSDLLRLGIPRETAVKAVNSVLMMRSGEETFATVDLALIDLYTGLCELTKVGATTTFLRHGDTVTALHANNLPAGILKDVTTQNFALRLEPGDMLVMVSDGLLESQTDIADRETWVKHILSQVVTDDPQEIADYLLSRAANNARRRKDDMSVLVAAVYERRPSILRVAGGAS